MLRASFSQCGKRLAAAGGRTSFSTMAKTRPAVALSRRDVAATQFRRYAIAAEDTNKGVVCLSAMRDARRPY
jgi:2-oxoglutarate dehydrogenase E1 component